MSSHLKKCPSFTGRGVSGIVCQKEKIDRLEKKIEELTAEIDGLKRSLCMSENDNAHLQERLKSSEAIVTAFFKRTLVLPSEDRLPTAG